MTARCTEKSTSQVPSLSHHDSACCGQVALLFKVYTFFSQVNLNVVARTASRKSRRDCKSVTAKGTGHKSNFWDSIFNMYKTTIVLYNCLPYQTTYLALKLTILVLGFIFQLTFEGAFFAWSLGRGIFSWSIPWCSERFLLFFSFFFFCSKTSAKAFSSATLEHL